MLAHADLDRHRMRLLLLFLIILAAMWPLRAAGDPTVDDPARGPYDDRGELAELAWDVPLQPTEGSPPALSGNLTAGGVIGGVFVMLFGAAEDRPRLVDGFSFVIGPSQPVPPVHGQREGTTRLVIVPVRGEHRAVPALAMATRF